MLLGHSDVLYRGDLVFFVSPTRLRVFGGLTDCGEPFGSGCRGLLRRSCLRRCVALLSWSETRGYRLVSGRTLFFPRTDDSPGCDCRSFPCDSISRSRALWMLLSISGECCVESCSGSCLTDTSMFQVADRSTLDDHPHNKPPPNDAHHSVSTASCRPEGPPPPPPSYPRYHRYHPSNPHRTRPQALLRQPQPLAHVARHPLAPFVALLPPPSYSPSFPPRTLARYAATQPHTHSLVLTRPATSSPLANSHGRTYAGLNKEGRNAGTYEIFASFLQGPL